MIFDKDRKGTVSVIMQKLAGNAEDERKEPTTIDRAPHSDPEDPTQMGILTAADELSQAFHAKDSRGIVNSLRSLIEMIGDEREERAARNPDMGGKKPY